MSDDDGTLPGVLLGRLRRERTNLTVRELAMLADASELFLARVEAGEATPPSPMWLQRVAAVIEQHVVRTE